MYHQCSSYYNITYLKPKIIFELCIAHKLNDGPKINFDGQSVNLSNNQNKQILDIFVLVFGLVHIVLVLVLTMKCLAK